MNKMRALIAVVAAWGAFNVSFGLWALIAPRSFFNTIATYPPYNEHLLHDIGAFMTGLGAVLLIALFRRSAIVAALAANGIGAALHAGAHIIDRNLGGKPSDPVLLTVGAVVVVGAAVISWRGNVT